MTIADAREKSKKILARIPQDVLLVSILILACLASFGLGFMAGRDAGQGNAVVLEPSPVVSAEDAKVVASKNGTKFYLPWCAGAERISEVNKVWFASAEAAVIQGYAPAANCSGL